MKPVAYSVVSKVLRDDCPDLIFVNDWDVDDGEAYDDIDIARYDSGGFSDSNGQYDAYGMYYDDNVSDGTSQLWTLTDLLQTKQCQKCFSVVTTSTGSDPQVIAHFQALILGTHRNTATVADILAALHTMTVHTADRAYKAARDEALQQQQLSEANAAASVSFMLLFLQLSSVGFCCAMLHLNLVSEHRLLDVTAEVAFAHCAAMLHQACFASLILTPQSKCLLHRRYCLMPRAYSAAQTTCCTCCRHISQWSLLWIKQLQCVTLPSVMAEWDWTVKDVPCQEMGCCALCRHVLACCSALVGAANTDLTCLWLAHVKQMACTCHTHVMRMTSSIPVIHMSTSVHEMKA